MRTAFAWLSAGWVSAFLKALLGVLTIVAAGYMIANPEVGTRALAISLTVYLFLFLLWSASDGTCPRFVLRLN